MLTKLIFIFYLLTGTIVPQDEHEGRKTYAIFFKDGKVIDYAYEAEIYNWINQGSPDEFQYNETLED
jgi:hypothetical protein